MFYDGNFGMYKHKRRWEFELRASVFNLVHFRWVTEKSWVWPRLDLRLDTTYDNLGTECLATAFCLGRHDDVELLNFCLFCFQFQIGPEDSSYGEMAPQVS